MSNEIDIPAGAVSLNEQEMNRLEDEMIEEGYMKSMTEEEKYYYLHHSSIGGIS